MFPAMATNRRWSKDGDAGFFMVRIATQARGIVAPEDAPV
jgi:hypothetical protein